MVLSCASVLHMGTLGLSQAARPIGLDEPDVIDRSAKERHKSGVAVLKVQEALSEMGYYLGQLDGHLNEDTKAAVRIYQEAMGQKVDGRITRQLWDLLNNAVQVRGLLKRLDTARKSGKDKARNALLSHSATQDLITDTDKERANPTRNADACFATPTVRCLLTEARESVKAVFKPELRDWALGEILVAQARAGLSDQAMKTASSIRDPRLIIVALRDIAEAQAAAGNSEQALEAVNIIPDLGKRAEALAKIAQIHARQGDKLSTRTAANALLEMIENITSPSRQISFNMQISTVFQKTGSPIRANRLLEKSEKQARLLSDDKERGQGLRHIATTLARLGRTKEALVIADDATVKSDREPILLAIATAMADRHDIDLAIETALNIAPRYRATILSHILLAQFRSASSSQNHQTAALAESAIELIKLPYARSYAQSRLALTTAKIGVIQNKNPKSGGQPDWFNFIKAAELASKITDPRLRAYTLWSVGCQQRHAGDEHGAEATEALADRSTGDIKSQLSRVWMFADLAAQHARQGYPATGWEAFQQGLKISKSIDNAWSRARSLAKLAQTLIELIVPGKGQEDVTFEN